MAYRMKARRGKDRRIFSRTASMTNSANLGINPMRGGYRF